jgi:hypothetical protein
MTESGHYDVQVELYTVIHFAGSSQQLIFPPRNSLYWSRSCHAMRVTPPIVIGMSHFAVSHVDRGGAERRVFGSSSCMRQPVSADLAVLTANASRSVRIRLVHSDEAWKVI